MFTVSEVRQVEVVEKMKEVRILDGNIQVQFKEQEQKMVEHEYDTPALKSWIAQKKSIL